MVDWVETMYTQFKSWPKFFLYKARKLKGGITSHFDHCVNAVVVVALLTVTLEGELLYLLIVLVQITITIAVHLLHHDINVYMIKVHTNKASYAVRNCLPS